MPRISVLRESKIVRTPRVIQLEGLFDIPPNEKSAVKWEVNLPIEEREWNVGLIVGPSGSGKTTIARELFKDYIIDEFEWDPHKSVLDNFPEHMSINEIVELLSSIGFASPPNWLRPYHVLSNGEKFRVFIARTLAEGKEITVIDEFTSVVDRTVAKSTAWTVQKYVRKHNRKFVAVSCHYDIIEWLQPDWLFDAGTNTFTWSDGVRRRPQIEITVKAVHRSAWQLFKNFHYLSADLRPGAQCYVAFWGDEPVAFIAMLKDFYGYRVSRLVVLPDYQGLGIARALLNYIASIYKALNRVLITAVHPAVIHLCMKDPHWKLLKKANPSLQTRPGQKTRPRQTKHLRIVWTFEYIGRPNFEDARRFGLLDNFERGMKQWQEDAN